MGGFLFWKGGPWFSRKLSGQVGPLHNQPLTAIKAVGGFLFAQQFAQQFGFYWDQVQKLGHGRFSKKIHTEFVFVSLD